MLGYRELGFGLDDIARLPDDPEAAHAGARDHVLRWSCDRSRALHSARAQLYVADAPFGRHDERRAPRLAQYVHDAVPARRSEAAPTVWGCTSPWPL